MSEKFSDMEKFVEEILEGESLSLLDRLGSHEKEIAWTILQEIRDEGNSDYLKQLWQLDYDSEPPTIQEFLESPQYMKHVGDALYPKWKEELYFALDPEIDKHEIILRGCIGSGKTYVAAILCGYDACCLMHMKNPQKRLKLGTERDPIYFGLVSSDLSQVERNLWAYTLGFMKDSPFFRQRTNLQPDKDYRGLSVMLTNNIRIIAGSLPEHILGVNLYFGCLDEGNFRRSKDPQEGAFHFYGKMRNRIENRFLTKTGKGRVVLISSETGHSSFLERHCQNLKKNDDEGSHICQYAEWEILPAEKLQLTGNTFKVDIGDTLRSPRILDEGEEARSGAHVIEVDEAYRRSATMDLIGFLTDRAGIIPGRANKWFYNVGVLLEAFSRDNPSLSEVCELGLDTPYEAWEYLDEQSLLRKVRGVYEPRENPHSLRYIHIDLAKNRDHAGFSMCHAGDYGEGGTPVAWQDLAMAFKSSKDKPIDFDKIIGLILWLTQMGFQMGVISYDSWQSQHSLNVLEKAKYRVKTRSLDRLKLNAKREKTQLEYEDFRRRLQESRIKLVDSSLLRSEAVELLNIEGKPDHPENGSKDVIDSTVGCVANLMEDFGKTPGGKGDAVQNFGDLALEVRVDRSRLTENDLFEKEKVRDDNTFVNP